jgi:hypothetical protein
MIHNIKINEAYEGYYIMLDKMSDDKIITEYLGITIKFYFEKAIEFGGKIRYSTNLYFRYKRDANKFKEWLEKNIDSFLIAKALVGDL